MAHPDDSQLNLLPAADQAIVIRKAKLNAATDEIGDIPP
jgi:hypothetical protein